MEGTRARVQETLRHAAGGRLEDDLSYIKLINYGERVTTNRMRAYLPQRIVQFLTATHPTKHTIYLCRHGQSEYNTTGDWAGTRR